MENGEYKVVEGGNVAFYKKQDSTERASLVKKLEEISNEIGMDLYFEGCEGARLDIEITDEKIVFRALPN